MTMYASNPQVNQVENFLLQQEVGELLSKNCNCMDKTYVNKVYDPACGSGGSITIKFAEKVLGKEAM